MTPLLPKQFSRRDFTLASMSALFVGMAVTLIDCGDMQSGNNALGIAPTSLTPQGDAGPAAAAVDAKSGVVSSNHGHVAVVTAAQLVGDEDVVLHIRGTANHDHSVTLSGHQIDQIDAGNRISVESSLTLGQPASAFSHVHTVVFN